MYVTPWDEIDTDEERASYGEGYGWSDQAVRRLCDALDAAKAEVVALRATTRSQVIQVALLEQRLEMAAPPF